MHRLAPPSSPRYSAGTLSPGLARLGAAPRLVHHRVPAWRLFGFALVLLALAEAHL